MADYARLMEEGAEAEQVVAKLLAQIAGAGEDEDEDEDEIGPLRPACRICETPVPQEQETDINLGVIGVDVDVDGVFIRLAEELAGRLGLSREEAPTDGREEAVARLVEARTTARDRAFAEFRERVKTVHDFADLFATCIGCYNCSTACPICFCKECFFRTETFKPEAERYFRRAEREGALRMPPEILLYHLTRLNHMVASCIGCGLCESACPAELPLTLIFRAVGDGVQRKLKYTPGRSLEDALPLLPEFVPR